MSKSKALFNKVILLHPNKYHMLLNDSLSADFINRKLLPIFVNKSQTDFSKWLAIKEELGLYSNRKKNLKPNHVENLNNHLKTRYLEYDKFERNIDSETPVKSVKKIDTQSQTDPNNFNDQIINPTSSLNVNSSKTDRQIPKQSNQDTSFTPAEVKQLSSYLLKSAKKKKTLNNNTKKTPQKNIYLNRSYKKKRKFRDITLSDNALKDNPPKKIGIDLSARLYNTNKKKLRFIPYKKRSTQKSTQSGQNEIQWISL